MNSQGKAKMKVSGLDHLVLTVANIAATVQFYQDVLGMEAERFTPSDGSVRGAITSIYLRDPDGNLLEISNRL